MIRVLLYQTKNHYWWDKLVHAVTGSWYYHAALWIDGYIYEETAYFDKNKNWISGARKRKSGLEGDIYKLIDDAIVDEERVRDWAEQMIRINEPYNFPLLIAMPIIYPLRWLWRILNWSPFNLAVFGDICSSFVDKSLKAGGIDLLPEQNERYTTPGDIAKSEILEQEG